MRAPSNSCSIPPQEARLARALVELADTLVADFDVVELLTRLTDRCSRVSQADTDAGQALADIATIAILQHRAALEAQTLNSQLSNALNTRIVIEQAKGMLAEGKGIDLDQSFRVLRNHSRNHNLGLSDVAADVVAGTLSDEALDPLYAESVASCRPRDKASVTMPSSLGKATGALALSDRLRALLAAAVELVGPQNLDATLQLIVKAAASVAHASYSALVGYDDEGRITTFVHNGVDDATVERIGRWPEGCGLLAEVIVGADALRLDDFGSDARASGFPSGHPPMRSFLGVPVVRHGRHYGNLYLTEKRDVEPFDDDDEVLVVALAAFAAGAIERAELVDGVRERAEAIAERAAADEHASSRRELLAHTIAAQEAERARVSRDLHDDVGQSLTSVLLGLRLVEDSLNAPTVDLDDVRGRSAELRDLVVDALRRARQLAFDLRPTVLDDVGLAPALERLAADVARRAGLRVELAVSLPTDESLAPEIETVVYRVVQEALTNVVRHSRASTVSIAVTRFGDRVRAHIEDDGIGFDPSSRPDRGQLGVVGMEERAHLIGGTIAVTSRPGEGTAVLVEVPRG